MSPFALSRVPASSADCGCRVEIVGDALHAFPCGPEHEPALTAAARELCEREGIAFEVEE